MINNQINLNSIEFLVTYNCTSKCDHCSVYNTTNDLRKNHMDIEAAKQIIKELSDNFNINSIMTFGGEPLLYPEFVCQLHKTAKENNISNRQIITNGLWTKNKERIDEIVCMLKDADTTSLLVSIDAFHEKYLDYYIVEYTLNKIKENNISNVFLHPVWIKNKNDDNEYNNRTKILINRFSYLQFNISSGNVLFPAGRAIKNLSQYFNKTNKLFKGTCTDIPYTDPPNNIRSICFNPNGDVISCKKIGNINESNIIDILNNYDYKKNEILKILIEEGSTGLYKLAKSKNIILNNDGYYSLCDLCNDICLKMK